MIFVTVGTNPTMHFDRLIKPMDALAAILEEQVVIQCGCSTYRPRHARHFQFTTSEQIAELNRTARVIVTHAAAGSVIEALQAQRPVVVVPRRQHLKEHIDDHQLELAAALEQQKRAVVVYEPAVATLQTAIHQASAQQYEGQGAKHLSQALRLHLDQWKVGSARWPETATRRP